MNVAGLKSPVTEPDSEDEIATLNVLMFTRRESSDSHFITNQMVYISSCWKSIQIQKHIY